MLPAPRTCTPAPQTCTPCPPRCFSAGPRGPAQLPPGPSAAPCRIQPIPSQPAAPSPTPRRSPTCHTAEPRREERLELRRLQPHGARLAPPPPPRREQPQPGPAGQKEPLSPHRPRPPSPRSPAASAALTPRPGGARPGGCERPGPAGSSAPPPGPAGYRGQGAAPSPAPPRWPRPRYRLAAAAGVPQCGMVAVERSSHQSLQSTEFTP